MDDMTALRTALAVTGLSIALLAIAAPANAAGPSLPDGDTLIAASCLGGTDATIFDVNSTTGATTAIGSGNAGYECAYQASWDASSKTLYGTIWDADSVLVKWDTLTGALVEVGPVLDGVTPVDVDTLVIGLDGAAYVLDFNELYRVDLATGAATDLGALAALTTNAYGAAVDPTTGILYLLGEDGDLFTLDPVAVTATYVASWTFSAEAENVYGLAIDSAGIAWVVEYPGDTVYSALYSTPLATFGVAPVLSGDIVDTATTLNYNSWWVTIIDTPVKPALANTGVDVAPIAATGLLLGLVGVTLVVRRRRVA